jgi:hypothetical protein
MAGRTCPGRGGRMTDKTRKEKIRAYKETPKQMGIYRIHNMVNGKSLIASSTDLRARMNRQLAELKLKTHPNAALLNDWQTYGKDAFNFEILDRLEPLQDPRVDPGEDLKVLEALWLEKLQPFGYTTSRT